MINTIRFIILASSLLAASVASGATHNMPAECASLQACFAVMSGGDTLIIADGTYTGAANIITSTNHPPVGTSGAYTKIIAENVGGVFFGEAGVATNYYNIDNPGLGNAYIEYNGLTWLGGFVFNYATNYVKFFNCGSGNNIRAVEGSNFSTHASTYVLFEDCHTWGGGRYRMLAYQSNHVIYRRCVGRIDAETTTNMLGGFAFYDSSYCEAQNCILLDSNTPDYWTPGGLVGAFTLPNGGGTNNAFRGCIAINNAFPLHTVAVGFTSGNVFENIVGWDNISGGLLRGQVAYSHLTDGAISTAYGSYAAVAQYEGTVSVANSIFTGISISYGALGGTIGSDYNYLYNNAVNYYGTTPGAHDVTNVNPLAGSLEYLPRVESGSALAGVASDGGNIGATIIKRIGVSGTFYGDTGYNATTTDNLWPFPNESLIKTRFAGYSYSGVPGARGFAATGKQLNGTDDITLTSYVWEYLGNAIPSDIYGTSGGSSIGGMPAHTGTMQAHSGTMKAYPVQ